LPFPSLKRAPLWYGDGQPALGTAAHVFRVRTDPTRDDWPMQAAGLREWPAWLKPAEFDGAQGHLLLIAPIGWPGAGR
jgi:hypothetical protein